MIRALGDSITSGYGVAVGRKFSALLATMLGVPVENSAVAGHSALAHAQIVYSKNVVAGDKTTYNVGGNEHLAYKSDANKRNAFKKILEAQMAWLCIPSKTTSRDASVIKTGTWANDAFMGMYATAINATATFSFNGNTCFLGMVQIDGNGATYSVTVDGVIYGNYTANAPNIVHAGINYAPSLLIIDGVGAGNHSVVITKTNAAGYLNFDWFATPSMDAKLIQIGVPQLSAASYAQYSTSADNVIDYNIAIQETVTKMAQWLDVTFLPIIDVIHAIDLGIDSTHWNAYGHLKVANLLKPYLA